MKNRNLPTKLTLLAGVLLTLGAAQAQAEITLSGASPIILMATQIRGAEGTGRCGGGYGLGIGLVDLDHGLGAGATTYDHGGFLWCETYAPYLWSDQVGTSTLFELEGEFNWIRSIYSPSGMTPDGSMVVGGVIFLDRYTTVPWRWTADKGPVELLQMPATYPQGNAVAVSSDRRLIAGTVRQPRRGQSGSAVARW